MRPLVRNRQLIPPTSHHPFIVVLNKYLLEQETTGIPFFLAKKKKGVVNKRCEFPKGHTVCAILVIPHSNPHPKWHLDQMPNSALCVVYIIEVYNYVP